MGLFLRLMLICLTVCIARRLRLSGIRDAQNEIVQVEPMSEFVLQLFGSNLPMDGYYLTTSLQCEDSNDTDSDSSERVILKSLPQSTNRYISFSLNTGLSFKSHFKHYQLCNINSSIDRSEFLTISEKENDSKIELTTIFLCIYYVSMSAFSSGMTIGFMKFSVADLNRMLDCNEPVRTRARRILKFRKKSNWLVCTFSMFGTLHSVLFTTTIETQFEGRAYGGILSIIVPTVILFFFAEFIPQALCNSKFGFVLASGLWPVTVIVFIICAPVAWPASKIIDLFLGRDVREVMTEDEKMNIIRNMAKNANWKERKILEKATTFSSKTVKEVMTPIDKVFFLPSTQRLNKVTILTLVEKGFTRIPVNDIKNRENIYAVLNVKEVISYDLSKSPTVAEIVASTERKSTKMKYVISDMKVQQLMQQMRTGGFHIATVTKYIHTAYKVIGIITIEDILGQLFGEIEKDLEKTSNHRGYYKNDDNIVMIWCREAGYDPIYPLFFSQQLLVIQTLLQDCPTLRRLGFGVVEAKQLLTTDRIRKGNAGDRIPFKDNVLIIIWDGMIEVKRTNEEVPEEINIKRIDDGVKLVESNIQAFVCGKPMLKDVFRQLKLDYESVVVTEDIELVVCKTECQYFKIRVSDVTDVVNETETSVVRLDGMTSTPRILSPARILPAHSEAGKSPPLSPTPSMSIESLRPIEPIETSRLLSESMIKSSTPRSASTPPNKD